MRGRRQQRSKAAEVLPVERLIRRSFRAGAFFPLVALAILVAVGFPLRQVQENVSQAENYAAVLEGIVSDRTALFVNKAESASVLLGRSDQGLPASARLEQLVGLDDSIEAALVTDPSGKVIAAIAGSFRRVPEKVDTDTLDWISEHGSPYIGMPSFSEAFRAEAVVIAVPIHSTSGELLGMLQITLDTDWIFEAIQTTNDNLGVDVFLTDRQGLLVAHADEWRVLAGQKLPAVESGVGRGVEAGLSISGAAPVASWGGRLIAVASVPLSVVIPGAAAALLPMLFIAIAFVASRIARRNLVTSVVDPVHELGTTLQAYGPENLAVRMRDTGVEEINIVAHAFNSTADQLDSLVESLRESNSRFKTLFQAAPVGMALHTIDGEYLDTNNVYDEMFGISGEELSLDRIAGMVIPESAKKLRSSLGSLRRREADWITFDAGFRSTSGKVVWVIVTATVLPQPGAAVDHVVVQVVDVTELKEAQSILEELLVTKNQFLADVSHELRTPLTALIGLAELLRDPGIDLSNDERTGLIDTIVESGFDVSNMVEDLLTAARQEAGQLTVVAVPVNVTAQIRQALEVLNPTAKVAISGETAPAVADPGRVRQVLRNLLTNAIKYGGEHVSVELGTVDGMARASVIDDGPGVPEDMKERIFRSYERAHGSETHPSSVGIGLSISRELARRMGGDVQYRRKEGRTHFDFTVPLLVEERVTDPVEVTTSVG